MRKTLLRARKQDPASSFDKMGLIANDHSRQSAEAEPILDNRSHRTHFGSPAGSCQAPQRLVYRYHFTAQTRLKLHPVRCIRPL
jgi:hypothetical protein